MTKKKTEELPEPVFAGPMASSSHRAVRETIESIVIAFILAFLFRTFEAEAFVIPTGSMAPTLHGMHKDVECPQCGITYRVGASQESEEEAGRQNARAEPIEDGTCPQCGFKRHDLAREPSYGGDRILVNKFAYQLNEPERWDVIVFRFPGDAKMNYIKRLVGLPNETLEIHAGDVFTGPNPPTDAPLKIARKTHRKLQAMLQHVDDNHYIAKTLSDAGWPRRWQVDLDDTPGVLEEILDEESFKADGREGTRLVQRWKSNGSHPEETVSLHFSHSVASSQNWTQAIRRAESGQTGLVWQPDQPITDSLQAVSDFYSYNTGNESRRQRRVEHWVGDLAIECEVNVEELGGELSLALEEGGFQFRVMFDLESGGATVEIVDHKNADRILPFGDNKEGAKQPKAKTAITSTGKHKVMFANCDDKLYVWVDNKPIEFDGPTEFAPLGNTLEERTDLVPAHVGMRGFKGAIDHIKMYRDVFYIADKTNREGSDPLLLVPRKNNAVYFKTGPDQFFPLGDNSPESKDARIWDRDEVPGTPNVVDRRLLIGKALFIYWPYGQLAPRLPLFERFKLIR